MREWQSQSHVRWYCRYHVVWVPKYRKQAMFGQIRRGIGKILRELCQRHGVELVEGHALPDHVHLLLGIPPKFSVSNTGLYPDFPKSTNTLYLYILRAKLSVRPAQVDGIYVNIISHGSTPARTRACSDTTPRPDALYRALSRLDAVSDQAHVNVTHCQI